MLTLDANATGFWDLLRTRLSQEGTSSEVRERVAEILRGVRERGDQALVELTHRLENRTLSPAEFRLPPESLAAAARTLDEPTRAAITDAIACVRFFHQQTLPRSWRAPNPQGAEVGEAWYPLRRVGIYIPAGNVPLVSTVVMTVPLAQLAGVPEIVVCTPASRDLGLVSPQMLAVLHLCGVQEVYQLGGAQAIAAMAFGTETVPPVVKVLGPGNQYVAEAQRQLFGQVGVDLLPGPSEAMVIADDTARPAWVAADLLAQAEHGSGQERVVLVCPSAELAQAIQAEMHRQLPSLAHRDAIQRVLANRTTVIHGADLPTAIAIANLVAPEHLELHLGERTALDRCVREITTAGAILCGHQTPTVLGDFTAGPSHTLPTNGTGRFFSGLKLTDFMRRSSVVRYDHASLERARPVVEAFAKLEGLDAHAASLQARFEER